MVGTANLDKVQALQVIYEFFKHFQEWLQTSKLPTAADLEKHLTKNFQITSSGQLVGRSAAEYLTRMQKFQKKYARWEISKPLEEPLVAGDRIALHYKVDLTSKSGQQKQVHIMAVAKIEDHKIAQWSQVAHEVGAGDWDR